MQIDGDVETPAPQPGGQRDVVEETLRAATSGRHDHFVQVRVPVKNRSGGRLHDVGKMGIGMPASKRADERCGEDDVANEAQADEEDFH